MFIAIPSSPGPVLRPSPRTKSGYSLPGNRPAGAGYPLREELRDRRALGLGSLSVRRDHDHVQLNVRFSAPETLRMRLDVGRRVLPQRLRDVRGQGRLEDALE